jgi:hypothetical protein
MDNGTPNQDSDSGHGLFSRSLLDASSTASAPFVRVPTTDQLLTKTGPRKKKKRVSEVYLSFCSNSLLVSHGPQKILKASAANTNGVNIAQGDKVSLAGTKSVLVSAAVVKLPSRRRSLSVSTEPDDAHGTLTGQLNCKKGSFSTDSQISDGSVTIFSVSALLSATVSELKLKSLYRILPLARQLCSHHIPDHILEL